MFGMVGLLKADLFYCLQVPFSFYSGAPQVLKVRASTVP